MSETQPPMSGAVSALGTTSLSPSGIGIGEEDHRVASSDLG